MLILLAIMVKRLNASNYWNIMPLAKINKIDPWQSEEGSIDLWINILTLASG